MLAQVGDSRCYRLRDGRVEQITQDHTWVEEVVRSGVLPREAAEVHPHRHMLTRAVGTEPSVPIDVEIQAVQTGDVYLLCSDGLTNHVNDAEIEAILAGYGPSEAAWRLVSKALVGGGSDNCTCIVVRVDALVEA